MAERPRQPRQPPRCGGWLDCLALSNSASTRSKKFRPLLLATSFRPDLVDLREQLLHLALSAVAEGLPNSISCRARASNLNLVSARRQWSTNSAEYTRSIEVDINTAVEVSRKRPLEHARPEAG